jgi:hypothetical protein
MLIIIFFKMLDEVWESDAASRIITTESSALSTPPHETTYDSEQLIMDEAELPAGDEHSQGAGTA